MPTKNTFTSENQPAKRGRKKHVATVLKGKGFGKDQIRDIFSAAAALTESETKRILADDRCDNLTRVVLTAFLQAGRTGEYRLIKEIVNIIADVPSASTDVHIVVDFDQE